MDDRLCYRLMLLARRLDEEAVRLQRQGEIVAFPPMVTLVVIAIVSGACLGREALG